MLNLEPTFNPSEHLIQIRSGQTSKDYLPVAWRLVWFRSTFPGGSIETEMIFLDLDRETEEEISVWNAEKRRNEKVVHHAKGFVIFKATVKDGQGGIATGTKSEKAASFADFIEKAETGAIGRALAALGYGTQFTADELDESHRIVDSPIERSDNGNGKKQSAQQDPNKINSGQKNGIKNLLNLLGRPLPDNLDEMSNDDAKSMMVALGQEVKANKK